MTELTEQQTKLAEQLLISVIKREPTIEYNEIAKRIEPNMHWRQVGKEVGEISKLCYEMGLPLLSVKIVSKEKGTVGEGFFNLMKILNIDTDGKTERELFNEELKKIRECTEWHKLSDYLGLDLTFTNTEAFVLPEEVPTDSFEGAKYKITVNAYERDKTARMNCLNYHGYTCKVCGFNFEEKYGSIGKEFIHVHHIVPLSTIGKTYKVNGIKDLIPVCPNCHAMLHRKDTNNKYLTVNELSKLVK